MGTDIYGWVETRDPGSEWWDAAVRIHDIVYRQYGMFASLYGPLLADGGLGSLPHEQPPPLCGHDIGLQEGGELLAG